MKLKLFLIPLLALTLFAATARPASAGFLGDLWNFVTCAPDIECTMKTALVATQSFVVYQGIGKDFDDIEQSDVEAMLNGQWDLGFASAVGKIGGLAFTPPLDAGDYVRKTLANNILSSPVQAQTEGANLLDPIREVWETMRNIAYGLFIVVMLALGFGIIFQQQLPSRTVVTFTYALPKILLGLVLITFSYPIMALVVDLGLVFLNSVVLNLPFTSALQNTISITGGVAGETFSGNALQILGSGLANIAGMRFSGAVSLLVTVMMVAVYLVALGFAVVRLIISYAWILMQTIFSPLIFMLGTLPGQEGSIANFFKQVLAKALVFPAILFLMILGAYIATRPIAGYFTGEIVSPWSLGFANLINGLLAVVIVAASIKAPGVIEDALGIGGKRK